MKRTKTGIEGLDGLIGGGIPQGFSVLVSGSAGTGKTILGLQYLVKNAEDSKPGVYVTFEETKEDIALQTKAFGWDVKGLEGKGLLSIHVVKTADLEEVIRGVRKGVDEINAKTLVIDSVTKLTTYTSILSDVARELRQERMIPARGREIGMMEAYHILARIKDLGLTTILIGELPKESSYLSMDHVSEFECDGVIVLQHITGATSNRTLAVEKMRGTKIDDSVHPMEITDRGIVIREQDELYK